MPWRTFYTFIELINQLAVLPKFDTLTLNKHPILFTLSTMPDIANSIIGHTSLNPRPNNPIPEALTIRSNNIQLLTFNASGRIRANLAMN